MAKSRIYDLISQINTILGKPVSQILSGLSPKYYDRILRQRDALLEVRSQLEQTLAQNQDISSEAADSYQARIRELELSMEQPLSLLFNEMQPRIGLPNLHNQSSEKLEPEKLEVEQLKPEKEVEISASILERISERISEKIADNLVERVAEQVAEKVYDRLLVVVSQEQRSQLTNENAELQNTNQNLAQQITELQSLKEERLREFNLQQQQHQEAYADSVDFLNQFLHEGIRQPLQAAAAQMDSLKDNTEQVNQAIAQISLDHILEQTNSQTQVFLQEFVSRLNALFAKTLPALAEQIKSLRQEVDLSLESWQGKFNTHSEAMSNLLSQFQQQITELSQQLQTAILGNELPKAEPTSAEAYSLSSDQESLTRIFDQLTEIKTNLAQPGSKANFNLEIQNLEQRVAQGFEQLQTQQSDMLDSVTKMQDLIAEFSIQALSEQKSQNPENMPSPILLPSPDLNQIVQPLTELWSESSLELIREPIQPSPPEILLDLNNLAQELSELNQEIAEEDAREIAREITREIPGETEKENIQSSDPTIDILAELELGSLLDDLLIDAQESAEQTLSQEEQVKERAEAIAQTPNVNLSLELDDLLAELVDFQNMEHQEPQVDSLGIGNLTEATAALPELSASTMSELSELSENLLSLENSLPDPIEQIQLEPKINPDLDLDDISEISLETSSELISSDFDFTILNSFADSEEPDSEIIEIRPEPYITSPFSSAPSIPATTKSPKPEIKEKWILGIDFDSSKIQGWLYELNSARQIELLPIEAIAEVLNPQDYATSLPVQHFKPFLQVALPYLTNDIWQPQIQWQRSLNLSLQSLVSGFQDLLHKLEIPRSIRSNIQNVVLAHPTNWSDIYSLNLREVVLAAEIVSRPEQVIVIDQAIAPLLVMIQENQIRYPALLIDASTDHLCLSLVGAANQRNGNNPAIATRSYDYGGFAIAQDILTQLIYSRWRNAKNLNRDACNLNHLSLPTLGISDLVKRSLLRQTIAETEAGQELWQAANQILQQLSEPVDQSFTSSPEYTFEVMGFSITISHREVENQVLQLFIQRIGHEINALMQKAGGSATEIGQVLLCGNSTYFSSLDKWLGQKFSQSKVLRLQDSVIAQGLAIAPLFTPMLDLSRQQYSDYFLLSEICHLCLEREFSAQSLLSQLRNQGINTSVCEARILQILNNEISAQLFPWQELENKILFTDSLLHRELPQRKLFESTTEGNYLPNPLQLKQLQTYLELISGYLHQNLAEPLVLSLVSS